MGADASYAPVDTSRPTEHDLSLTSDLEARLRARNLYETEDGHELRKTVLRDLNTSIQSWVRSYISSDTNPYEVTDDRKRQKGFGIHLLTFGSYKLGVVTPGGDIDVTCVAANLRIKRAVFFAKFYERLLDDPNVENLVKVTDAYTPLMKFSYKGIDLDLLFAEVNPTISDRILSNPNANEVLKNVDEKSARSLNGVRVNTRILELVPNPDNFRTALRLVKNWADVRGVYSNVMGYLGGIAYAILVAKICQMYPYASASKIVYQFFRVFSSWNWRSPVLLCEVESYPEDRGLRHFQVWDPSADPAAKSHLMPIITPAFPCMNTTHNVTVTTKRVMESELKRGLEILEVIIQGEATWDDLLSRYSLFDRYEHFLIVEAFASGVTAYKDWTGWVESKIRFLVKRLEMNSTDFGIRPLPRKISFTPDARLSMPIRGSEGEEQLLGYSKADAWFIGLRVNEPRYEKFDCTPAIQQFVDIVEGWPLQNVHQDLVNVRVRYVTRNELPSYTARYIDWIRLQDKKL